MGSFLNVLIYRLPRSLKLAGRSFCPKCKKKILWYDNIPLLSFIFLKGKCHHCHSPISVQYPLVELLTGLLFLLTVFLFPKLITNYQLPITNYFLLLAYYLFLISSLIVIFFTDLKHQIIPDQVIYPTILITFLYPKIVYISMRRAAFSAARRTSWWVRPAFIKERLLSLLSC